MSGATYSQAQLEAIAAAAAQKYNVPQNLFLQQINQESSFNPNPSTGVPGGGIAQFIPSTAQNVPGYGQVNPLDPVAALNAAAAYDASLYQQTGTWSQTLQSYGTTAKGAAANNVALQTAIQNADAGNMSATQYPIPAPAGTTFQTLPDGTVLQTNPDGSQQIVGSESGSTPTITKNGQSGLIGGTSGYIPSLSSLSGTIGQAIAAAGVLATEAGIALLGIVLIVVALVWMMRTEATRQLHGALVGA